MCVLVQSKYPQLSIVTSRRMWMLFKHTISLWNAHVWGEAPPKIPLTVKCCSKYLGNLNHSAIAMEVTSNEWILELLTIGISLLWSAGNRIISLSYFRHARENVDLSYLNGFCTIPHPTHCNSAAVKNLLFIILIFCCTERPIFPRSLHYSPHN